MALIKDRNLWYNKTTDHICKMCGNVVYVTDKYEIIQTKRKSLNFYHYNCIHKFIRENGN